MNVRDMAQLVVDSVTHKKGRCRFVSEYDANRILGAGYLQKLNEQYGKHAGGIPDAYLPSHVVEYLAKRLRRKRTTKAEYLAQVRSTLRHIREQLYCLRQKANKRANCSRQIIKRKSRADFVIEHKIRLSEREWLVSNIELLEGQLNGNR